VISADSAAGALELLNTHPKIDVVITDYSMPGMTGGELAAEIHRIRPELPVVIATGYSDSPKEMETPRLSKPYRQQDVAILFARLFGPPPGSPTAVLDPSPSTALLPPAPEPEAKAGEPWAQEGVPVLRAQRA
jgi:DNA-binding LytR/AlgR family response regulator